MVKKTFIDRKTAKHFHVVHRSQRDPLINDTDASELVLQEVVPGNIKKYKTKEELAALQQKPIKLTQDEIDQRVGQAALHGIYFDDAEYDYMQHLKPMGNNPEAVFLEAPGKREKPKPGGLVLRDEEQDGKDRTLIHLPTSVLPSTVEIGGSRRDTGLENGLQPDMDPRLREVMEALEDEEYVEDQLQDSFFDELNEEGELYDPEEEEWEEEEEEEEEVEEVFDNDGTYDWQAAFRNFQKNKKQEGSDDEDQEEKADRQTVGTGFSMSSSVMHRNSQLRLLDDRFEKIEEEYMNDDDEEEDEFGEERADFDDILDDFLDKYEVVGKKMQFKLDGDTSEQLATIRQALTVTHLSEHNESILTAKVKEPKKDTNGENLWSRPVQRERAAWDCQSVLSTYSNLENHPQLISDRGPKKKITIDPKTGMPVLIEVERKLRKKNMKKEEEDENEEDEEDEEDEEARQNLGVRRSKEESKEDKKLRKQAVKDAKKNRRIEKKTTQIAFKNEESRQQQVAQQRRKAKGVAHIP